MAWWLRKFAALAAMTGCFAMVEVAAAQESSLPPGWLTIRMNERGQRCEHHAEIRDGNQLLVACGASGVWEIGLDAASPRFIRSFDLDGSAVGFITESGGRLWVKLQFTEARPFRTLGGTTQAAVDFPDSASDAATPPLPATDTGPTAPATSPTQSPVQRVRRHAGRVTRSSPGEVVISLGTLDNVRRSDRIELAVEQNDAGADAGLSRETVAIGVVTHVTEETARVHLGFGETVPVGAFATPTSAPATASLSAPPRASGLWELQLFARPFAALGELGAGALLSGSFGYRFDRWHVQAIVDPLGVGDVQDKNAVGAFNAAVLASYDSQYFEMGLGFGAQTVNDPDFFLQPGSGLAALQVIRLGALDGLNISARTNIALFHSEFQFGGMVASGQIPVTRGYWLLLNGGGGSIGYGFGELGLRVLLAGNGLAGSKFLTVTAGGAAVFRAGSCDPFSFCETNVYGGPMAGVGGEWRF